MAPVLQAENLTKKFRRGKEEITAADHVSFFIEEGECLGLMGESGGGKSTVARMAAGLVMPDEGRILLRGEVVEEKSTGKNAAERRRSTRHPKPGFSGRVQMVFQNPQGSFDPGKTLGAGIREGLRNAGMSKEEAYAKMRELLFLVELDASLEVRYPHEVSGGQCQRAAIARALATNPGLVICDEAVSALDAIAQAQIVALIKKLRERSGPAALWICHDPALIQALCSRVLVMHQGKIIEEGSVEEVFYHPKEKYTQMLLDAAF